MAEPPRPPTQHAFGQTPVQVDLSADKGSITVPELLKLATNILTRAKRSGLVPNQEADFPKFDKLYQELWGKYKDFAKEFPITFRWIVHQFDYDERAFRAYLMHTHKGMWKNKKEMYMAQGEYLVLLRRQKRRDESSRQLEAYRKHIRSHLNDEFEKFEAAAKEAEEIHKKNAEERTQRIRESLRATAARSK